MVIALAGRRVDAAGAVPARFPRENVPRVEERLRRELEATGARALVCSAACGADLVALAVARELRLKRRAVLPFPVARFRETSVVDRPGEWGSQFDGVVRELRQAGDLVILDAGRQPPDPYLAANSGILDEAQTLARETRDEVLAFLVWDGQSRGDDDVTAAFGDEARRRGLRVVEVSTC
jgi:hypothetical protein